MRMNAGSGDEITITVGLPVEVELVLEPIYQCPLCKEGVQGDLSWYRMHVRQTHPSVYNRVAYLLEVSSPRTGEEA